MAFDWSLLMQMLQYVLWQAYHVEAASGPREQMSLKRYAQASAAKSLVSTLSSTFIAAHVSVIVPQ